MRLALHGPFSHVLSAANARPHGVGRARARVRVQSSDLLENKEAPGNAPFGSRVAPTSNSQKSAVCWPYVVNIIGHSLLRI